MKQLLDHLILFVPCDPESRTPIIPSCFKDNFTLTPGGTHADGLTANTLVLLADGCYIELICFLPQSSGSTGISTHWWGPDADRKGWADWCLTNELSPDENYEKVKTSHAKPIPGGRKRPDGKEVKWAVTFPQGENGGQAIRGKIPFFCHDVTPRDYRVPIAKESTTHPCGALCVSRLNVLVETEKDLGDIVKFFEHVTGVKPVRKKNQVLVGLHKVKDLLESDGLCFGPDILIRLAESDEEKTRVNGKGFWYGDVVFAGKAGKGKEVGPPIRLDNEKDDFGGLWLEYEEPAAAWLSDRRRH